MRKFSSLVKGLVAGTVAGVGLYAASKGLQQRSKKLYGPIDELRGTCTFIIKEVSDYNERQIRLSDASIKDCYKESTKNGLFKVSGKANNTDNAHYIIDDLSIEIHYNLCLGLAKVKIGYNDRDLKDILFESEIKFVYDIAIDSEKVKERLINAILELIHASYELKEECKDDANKDEALTEEYVRALFKKDEHKYVMKMHKIPDGVLMFVEEVSDLDKSTCKVLARALVRVEDAKVIAITKYLLVNGKYTDINKSDVNMSLEYGLRMAANGLKEMLPLYELDDAQINLELEKIFSINSKW